MNDPAVETTAARGTSGGGFFKGRGSLVAAFVAILLVVPLPAMGRAGRALQDLAHVPVGALLALLLYGRLRSSRGLGPSAAAVISFVVVGGALAAVEVVQPFTGRTRSLVDLVAGLLGATGALVAVHGWVSGGVARVLGLVAGGILLGLGALPAATTLYDVWRQRHDAPMLASFEDDLEMTRWWFADATARRVGEHATSGLYSLRVELHAAEYPGATMGWPLADWRGYRALAVDLHVDGAEPLDLILKVSDAAHDGRYEDRFHEEMHLEPGDHRIRIPLERIANAPAGRTMDLGRVAGVQLFVDGLEHARTIHVDALRLLGMGP